MPVHGEGGGGAGSTDFPEGGLKVAVVLGELGVAHAPILELPLFDLPGEDDGDIAVARIDSNSSIEIYDGIFFSLNELKKVVMFVQKHASDSKFGIVKLGRREDTLNLSLADIGGGAAEVEKLKTVAVHR